MVPLLRRTRTIATCVSKFLAKISYNWWISSTQVWFSTENNMKMQSRILGKRQNHSKPPIPGSCPAIQVAVAGKPVSWSNSRAGTAGFGDLVGNIHFGPNFSVAKMFYFDLLCIFCWVPGFMSVWFLSIPALMIPIDAHIFEGQLWINSQPGFIPSPAVMYDHPVTHCFSSIFHCYFGYVWVDVPCFAGFELWNLRKDRRPIALSLDSLQTENMIWIFQVSFRETNM